MNQRSCGILLHITSLPSQFGIGDLGPSAYQFVDFLSQSKQHVWQILPLTPTDGIFGNSPYSSHAAFAGNLLLISPELLVEEGFLSPKDLEGAPKFPSKKVSYDLVAEYKTNLFQKAYQAFKNDQKPRDEYEKFCQLNHDWLDDYCLFVFLKDKYRDKSWSDWPAPFRDRDHETLQGLSHKCFDDLEKSKFLQYIFHKQWLALKLYCQEKGVKIFGDIPVYVNYDSADVWSHPEYFKLDSERKSIFVAGVPPDYFSEDGQRWGNPVYDWDRIKQDHYGWWKDRMRHNFMLYDIVRIDHFRGFNAFWEIPAQEKTGKNGQWVKGPADEFFLVLQETFGELPIVAEDLGVITPDVVATMKRFGFLGMKVLMFAFGEDLETHPYIPENYTENFVVYTGTHDNNTVKGWYKYDATDVDKENLEEYLKKTIDLQTIHQDFIQMAMRSKANIAIIPLQDILGLGKEARMNQPATKDGNWGWRVSASVFTNSLASKLAQNALDTGRA